ncbi:unnamed protein product [Mytilus coruscus]|uniref:ATP-dependent DNA helicase n=1 Tax=Mytilus coruscus TaxID=42192 RepID=A0A6J8DNL6_MYTCO|nr:unnamed protein product [Mytilus coruscus]
MDIQIIGNAESAAYYVCAYLCKSEPEDLKDALSELISNIPEETTQRQRLLKIGCCVLKTRKLSAQEAAYRLSDLHLISTSRTNLYLNVKPPELRYRLLKPKSDRDKLEDNSTDIFCYNMLDYYRARPLSYENLSFYEFAQWFVKCKKPRQLTQKASIRIQLQDPFSETYMRKRLKCVVIKLPKFSVFNDAYFYSLILCFLPHRKEQDILKKNESQLYDSAHDSFISKKNLLSLDFLENFALADEIENAIKFIRYSRLELGISLLPSTFNNSDTFTNNTDIQADISVPHLSNSCVYNESSISRTINTTDTEESQLHELSVCLIPEDQLLNQMNSMTNDQKKVMNFVKAHFQSIRSNVSLNSMHIFITGGGGVGKSFLIRIMIEWLRRCTINVMGIDPVVVCAPTGTAAKNINGRTLHSTLRLPVQHGKEPSYMEVSALALKTLRHNFQHIHTIIIDEISMKLDELAEYAHELEWEIIEEDDIQRPM